MLKPWKYNLIEQYFAAEISDEDLKKFQKLSKTDPLFVQEVQKYASQAALLEDIIEENTPQDKSRQQLKTLFQVADESLSSVKNLKPNRSSFFLRIAASLAILILFSWVIYTTISIKPLKDLADQNEDSEIIPPHIEDNKQEEQALAQDNSETEEEDTTQEPDSQNNYEEVTEESTQQPIEVVFIDSTRYYTNASLENQMLALNSRASSVLTQIFPSNNQRLKNQINFKWVIENASEITLEVFNNQKEVILEQYFDEPTQGYKWNAINQPAGLYYWRLLGEEDILYMGKFYLNTDK